MLFDVDGILVKSKSFGTTSLLMKKHFEIEPLETKVYMEGKTYRWILKERLKEAGIKNPEDDARFTNMLEDATLFTDMLKKGKLEKIPHVENLIKKLLSENITIGLLTGNTKKITEVKLNHVKLNHYFKIGAFGADTNIRFDLVSIAVKDAKNITGIDFGKKDIFIVGDTIEDIKCAKKNNVKIISVATGSESYNHLKSKSPNFLFRDFKNTEKILSVIRNPLCK